MHEWRFSTGPRGLTLQVCEWPGPDPVVVVLHGFLEQAAAWDRVARQLGRRVVAPDHRGHGRSDHVGAGGFYHFWDYAADLDALVDHLGGPIDLVGHSMGGTLAALYAGARPERVRRLVLVEGLGPPDTTDLAVDRAREFLDHRRSPPAHRPMADLFEGVRRVRTFNPRLSEDEAARLVALTTRPVDEGLAWSWDPLHRSRSPAPFQADLFRRFLERIEAPTLLVDGGASVFVIPDREQRQAALRDARREVIAQAGHLVHHDAPDDLARVIRAHLDGAE